MSHILRTIGVTSITDITDASKALGINLASATTETTTTVNIAQTANRSWTLPDGSSTFVGTDLVQTTTNKTNYEPSAVTVTAAGATQGTATALTNMYNNVTTVAASTGVSLPVPLQSGLICRVANKGANTLNVYPASGGTIDALGANNPFTLASGGTLTLESTSATQWYSVSSYGLASGVGPVNSVTGTANQVSASPTIGAVIVSTPATFLAPGTIQDSTGMLYSTTNGIAAAGTTQGAATGITTSYVIVTSATLASAQGVRLPVPTTGGLRVVVANRSTAVIYVYPAVGGQIDALGTNIPYGMSVNAIATFQAATTTQWYVSAGVTSGSGFGSLLTEVNASASFSTSSTTPAIVTGMTYTVTDPITKCLVFFNATFTASAAATASYAVYKNGVLVINSDRLNAPPGSGALASLSTQCVVTPVVLGDVIDVRCSRTGAGTVTVTSRSIIILGIA